MLNKFPDSTINKPEANKPSKAETAETKEEITLKIQNELSRQGKLNGINFSFLKPRFLVAPEKLPSELNLDYFSPDISEEEKARREFCFQRLIQYLDSPIITDNIPNHNQRRDWETENLGKLSPEAQAYYNRNRLGLNFASGPNKLNDIINEDFKDGMFINRDIFDKLNVLINLLPLELQNGHSEDYAELTTDEKIAVTDKAATIMAAIVRTLGRKKLEQAN
jgi:hypothetical protein